MKRFQPLLLSAACILVSMVQADPLEEKFKAPPREARPETWFHLIGGNVGKEALTVDLEAVAGAGLAGIQLFHGNGNPWPGVSPQITCLGPAWDGMIAHVGNETARLNLAFTMQNCPGWAMSGGPWITPENAMRHLVWSRRDVAGGAPVSVELEQPQPSAEAWRDYRDVAVLAFPTPAGDSGGYLVPAKISSNRNDLPWADLLAGNKETKVRIQPGGDPAWVELEFAEPVFLRSMELPPTEFLMLRRIFDPDSAIRLAAWSDSQWVDLATREIPRGVWQDREGYPICLAFPDFKAQRFRIVFENQHPMELGFLRLSSAARVNHWCSQAGYVLRSLDRSPVPQQNPAAWVASESIIDLTGMKQWDAPAGHWTMVRFGHVNTGAKNKPAPPEATGFECNKLSPNGADLHFAGYIGRLSKPGGPVDGGRLQGMLIDSWECYTQTWTPAMEQEFGNRRGYALRQWLPALAGWLLPTTKPASVSCATGAQPSATCWSTTISAVSPNSAERTD